MKTTANKKATVAFAEKGADLTLMIGLPIEAERHPKLHKLVKSHDLYKKALGDRLETLITEFFDGAEPYLVD